MKIHYHSDCQFFAGCEKMLINFWTNAELRQNHLISFSYRQSLLYTEGLHKHLSPDFPVFPLFFPVQNWPEKNWQQAPVALSKITRFLFRFVTRIPFIIYDVLVLSRLFRKLAPDLIHINNGSYPAARSARAAAVAAKLAGVKYVLMVVNNQAAGYRNPDRWFDFLFDRLVVHSTNKFVTGSKSASLRLQKVLKLRDSQIQSIHNGIKLRPVNEAPAQVRQRLGLNPQFNGVIIGVVALMEVWKGHRIMIESLAKMTERHPKLMEKLVVWFEGDGSLRGELETLVAAMELSGVVRFIGHESHVINMMNAVDILVLPSISDEDFPNVTLEAMGLGRAVIASSLAGTPEQIIHGETGLLVEPGDTESLAEAIFQLASTPGLIKRMGISGKKRFDECFGADIAVKKYVQLYDSIGIQKLTTYA